MRDCKNCKHLIMYDYKNKSYSCEKWECKFEPKEQEPTTKNDLAVDREDAVERLNAIKQLIGYDKDSEIVKATQKSLDMAIKALKQEPKTGHWIFVGEENKEETKAGNFRYVCSGCGFSDVHGKSIYVPYCWQCGAKMAESEET